MNKHRKKAIEDIAFQLEDAMLMLEMYRDEEQIYLDNMPESLQYSEKGEKAIECISYLDDAINDLGTVYENVNLAIE